MGFRPEMTPFTFKDCFMHVKELSRNSDHQSKGYVCGSITHGARSIAEDNTKTGSFSYINIVIADSKLRYDINVAALIQKIGIKLVCIKGNYCIRLFCFADQFIRRYRTVMRPNGYLEAFSF